MEGAWGQARPTLGGHSLGNVWPIWAIFDLGQGRRFLVLQIFWEGVSVANIMWPCPK